MNQRYSAFAATPELDAITRRFLANMAAGSAEPQAPTVIELLHRFMDEVLDSYFLAPMQMIQLNPMGERIVNAGVSAIRKTSKMAITKVVGKLNNEELKPLASYVDQIMFMPPPESDAPTYVAIPITQELDERLCNAINSGRANGPQTVIGEFAEAMCGFISESTVEYFERPVSMMKLGYLSEKFAKVAMESGRAASQAVVRKASKTMSDQELLSFFRFAESIMKEMPAKS